MGNKSSSRIINNIQMSLKPQDVSEKASPWAKLNRSQNLDEFRRALACRYESKPRHVIYNGLDLFAIKDNNRWVFYLDSGDGIEYPFFRGSNEQDFSNSLEEMSNHWKNDINFIDTLNNINKKCNEQMGWRKEGLHNLLKRNGSWDVPPQFNNIESAEIWLRQQHGMSSFFFSKSDDIDIKPQEINESVAVLFNIQNNFPGLIGMLDGINFQGKRTFISSNNINANIQEEVLAVTKGIGQRYIVVNLDSVRDHHKYLDLFEKKQSLENVLYHEMGHVISALYPINLVMEKPLQTQNTTFKKLHNNFTFLRDERTGAYTNLSIGKPIIDHNRIKEAQKITSYAGVSPAELHAEAFAYIMNDKNKKNKIMKNYFLANMEIYTKELSHILKNL